MLSFNQFTSSDNPHRAANSVVISRFKIASFLLLTLPFAVYYVSWNHVFHLEQDHAWRTTACGIAAFVATQLVIIPYVVMAFLEPLDADPPAKGKQKAM